MANVLPQFKQKYQFYALSVLSGILIGTSFIPYPAWAILFCYIPLWFSVVKSEKENFNLKQQFLMGWISQFILTLIGFNWIYYTASEFGHLHWSISVLTLLLFASAMHIYIPLSLLAATWMKRRFNLTTAQHIFVIALTSSLFERIWPSIFQWNMGYTLFWMKWPVFNWADTIGFLGLSSLIYLIQGGLLIACLNLKIKKILSLKIFSFIFIFLILINWTGHIKQKKWSATNRSIQIAITQANVGNEEKLISELGPRFQSSIAEKYITLVDDFLKTEIRPDIILWPETALPFPLDSYFSHRPLQNRLQSKIHEWKSVLVTGAYSHDLIKKDIFGETLIRNSIFFLDQNGILEKNYNKSQLLAFGEYLPFGELVPSLYKLFPFVGTFEKGAGPENKRIKINENYTLNLGPQICYESLDPEFSRHLAKKGSEIIFNVTNDSWFGDWAEPYQHLYMTLARGIEVRRPVVRSTNTGFSSVSLANGTVLEKSKMNESWMKNFNVTYQSDPELTFYVIYGHYDWIVLICLLFFVLLQSRFSLKIKNIYLKK